MNIIKTTHLILLSVFFALVGNSAIAEQTSASYRIVNQVLPAGGGYQTSTGYSLSSVIGQASPIGESSNSNYSFAGGFLAGEKTDVAQPVDLVTTVGASPICPDEPFDVTFKIIATSTQPVESVQLYLKFDPTILKVNKISNGTALDYVLQKGVSETGYLKFVSMSFINPPQTDAFDLMTVSFTALQKSVETLLQINTDNSNLISQGNYLPLKANDTNLVIGNCLKCIVDLQGREAKPHESWITTLDIHTDEIQSIITDDSGNCYLPTTVSPGNHSFCVKNSHTLANRIGPPINDNGIIDLGILLEGDVNDDNEINQSDPLALKQSLDKCIGDDGYNTNADFNVDGCVNNTDIAIAFGINGNFGKHSVCGWDNNTNTLRRGQRRGNRGAVTLSTTEIPASLAVGNSFDMAIQVNAGESQPIDITAVYLNFDPKRLQVNKLTASESFEYVLQSNFDNSTGEIDFAAISWRKASPKGSFTLVTVNLTLLDEGGAESLSFNTSEHRETIAMSEGKSVTSPENVGEVVIEKIVDNGEPVTEDDSEDEPEPNTPDDLDDGEEEPGIEEPAGKYTTSGIINDKAGNPVVGVTVQIGDKTIVTDEAGNWEITELPEGEYTITASKDGYTFEPAPVNLTGDETSLQVTLVVLSEPVEDSNYTTSGTIRDKAGNPVAGVTVQVGDKTVVTNEAGDWEITGLPEGDNYTATASKDGYTFAPIEFALGNDEFKQEVVMKPLSAINVKVVAEPSAPKQGENITFIATVINGGSETATGVALTNVLSSGSLVSIEALDGGECDADTVICTLPDLTTGATAKVKLVVSNSAANKVANEATVTANEYPADVHKKSVNITPHLSVSASCTPQTVMPEGGLHCTAEVVLSSLAPNAATGVELVMTLPNGVELQSLNTDYGMCDVSNMPILTCSMTDLSVDSPDDISSVAVNFEEVLQDPGLLALTHDAKVTANGYPAHTSKARTKIFIPPEYQVDFAIVIDVTGSMEKEMDGTKSAVNNFIKGLKAQNQDSPLTALVVFRDEVMVKAVTTDLSLVETAISKMEASGGGTCPEASVEALDVAITHVKEGGTIFFVTDASPYEDADIAGIMERMGTKGIIFNAIITGDCTNKDSWNVQP